MQTPSTPKPRLLSLVAVMDRGVVGIDEPAIHADDLGLVRGDGCFDSARLVVSPDGSSRVDHLDEHLARLGRSATALDIAMPARDRWDRLIDEAVEGWLDRTDRPARDPLPEATARFVLTRGREGSGVPTALLVITAANDDGAALAAARRGIAAVTLTSGHPSDAYRDAPWLLGGVKTLSYVSRVAAQREAAARGADDAIFTTTDGYCLDGTTSGLLVASGGRLRSTPSGDTGLLESVTVSKAAAGLRGLGREVIYELIPVADLSAADGVWLLSAGRGVAPVRRLDGRDLPVDRDLTTLIARAAGFGDA